MKLKMIAFGLGALALVAAGCNKQAAQVRQNSQPVVQNNEQQGNMATSSAGADMAKDQKMSDEKILAVLFRDNEALTVWPGNELAALDHDAMLDNGIKVSRAGLISFSDGKTVQLKNGQEVDRKGSIKQANADLMKMKAMMPENNNMMNGASSTEGSMMRKPGSYINYSADALAAAEKSGGRTVLFFHANWCPMCQADDKDIRANLDKIPSGVTILITDYDTETQLKQKYGVTYQNTYVQIDKNGNPVTSWNNGGQGLNNILANLKS
jgi:thioredoxin 1